MDSVLDLMSSWVSHFPEDIKYSRVSAQGMNKAELEANPQLTDFIVQNLNTNQILPFEDEVFDLCSIAVSVQYLTSPVKVFEEIARVIGYDNITSSTNYTASYSSFIKDLHMLDTQIRSHLQAIGYYEHYSNSLYSNKVLSDE